MHHWHYGGLLCLDMNFSKTNRHKTSPPLHKELWAILAEKNSAFLWMKNVFILFWRLLVKGKYWKKKQKIFFVYVQHWTALSCHTLQCECLMPHDPSLENVQAVVDIVKIPLKNLFQHTTNSNLGYYWRWIVNKFKVWV